MRFGLPVLAMSVTLGCASAPVAPSAPATDAGVSLAPGPSPEVGSAAAGSLFRLPNDVHPTRERVALEVAPDQERFRGRVDIAVNGTYWAGAFLGTIVTLIALNHITTTLGWRVAYLVGPVLAFVIIFVRRHLPESPRWQIMHGRQEQAEESIAEIEEDVGKTKGELGSLDLAAALQAVGNTVCGGMALFGNLVTFRHSLPLDNLNINNEEGE